MHSDDIAYPDLCHVHQAPCPSQLEPSHWQEWLNSGISPDIIETNLHSLRGDTPYEYLCYSEKLERTNIGRLTPQLLRQYAHTEAGGWWCSGLDPFDRWQPMQWGCFKPQSPRIDFERRKTIKYEHPPRTATRAFFLDLPRERWLITAARYRLWLPEQIALQYLAVLHTSVLCTFLHVTAGVPLPTFHPADLNSQALSCSTTELAPTSFWQWVLDTPDLPILLVEGAKKAACLLSYGYIAIALPGIFNGRRVTRDAQGKAYADSLIPELELFATANRRFYFCFDHDTKPKTIENVNLAIAKTGKLLVQKGCDVQVITLPGPDKGVDDFIVAQGANAFEQIYQQALPLQRWQWRMRKEAELQHLPWLRLNVAELRQDYLIVTQRSTQRETLQQQLLTPDYHDGLKDILTPEILEHLRSAFISLVPQSPINPLPQDGIIGLASAKGTAKTKFIGWAIADSTKVLLLTHRICLGRALTARMGLTWKSDADKANGCWIADGERRTQRLALCVDSLLSIDPTQFTGCDLVIDEVVQVLIHLLTSDTCRKDGKRPALLARLHWLIQVAKRVIIADADLSDLVLNYIQTLRGSGSPIYLIRNDYKPNGYPVKFLRCPNESAITAQILEAVNAGRRILIQTDSKQHADAISALLPPETQQICITSDTSGEQTSIQFIQQINERITDYQVVIATPSMATGVSIEIEHFDTVYGLFFGTVTDADASQSLSRVRANVPRVVWCAEHGKNFSLVDSSQYAGTLKNALKRKYSQEVALIRTSLSSDLLPFIDNAYNLDQNPHIDLWTNLTAQINYSMRHLRENLIARLEYEGNQIEILELETDKPVKTLVSEAKQQNWQRECQARATARSLSSSDRDDLENRENLSLDDKRALEKARLIDFYAMAAEDVTAELVNFDDKGRKRTQISKLEMLLHPLLAVQKTSDAISKQARWQQGLWIPDLPMAESERIARVLLKLTDFLKPGQAWTNEQLEPMGEIARRYRFDIQRFLGFTIPDDPKQANNIWIYRRLLTQLGILTAGKRQSRKQTRSTWIVTEAWDELQTILERRQERRKLSGSVVQDVVPPPDY